MAIFYLVEITFQLFIYKNQSIFLGILERRQRDEANQDAVYSELVQAVYSELKRICIRIFSLCDIQYAGAGVCYIYIIFPRIG